MRVYRMLSSSDIGTPISMFSKKQAVKAASVAQLPLTWLQRGGKTMQKNNGEISLSGMGFLTTL